MKAKVIWLTLGFVIPLSLLFGAALTFGSLGAAASWINGKSFYLSPQIVRLDNRAPGAEEVVTFQLKNLSSEEISVVGEKASCSCIFSENIPIKVDSGKTAEVNVRVRLPKYKTGYNQSVILTIATPRKLEFAEARIVATIPNPLPELKEDGSEGNLEERVGEEAGGISE